MTRRLHSMELAARFKPYPHYRDSGLYWLGQIPAHWGVKRLKYVSSVNPSDSFSDMVPSSEVSFVPMEALGEWGRIDVTLRKSVADVLSGYTRFREGDVLLAKITPCFENGKGAVAQGLLSGVGVGTTELHVLRPGRGVQPTFLTYVTFSAEFRALGQLEMKGVAGQQRVPDGFVRNFRIAIPKTDEQEAIVDFLDCETAKIDALIARKERLIELLQEKRVALISRAVTKGLDPSVPMKDSGVDWLGHIPAHWDTLSAKQMFFEVNERVAYGEDDELLTVSHITGVTRRSEKPDVNMFLAESTEGYKRCRACDLVINTMWAWMGALGFASEAGIVSPSYNVYRPRTSGYAPGYYDLLVRTPSFAAEITRWSKGVWSSRLRLYPEEFFEVRFPVPAKQEQELISETIRKRISRDVEVEASVRQGIEILQQYRTALVSAAVAGKIDVRQEAM